MPKTFNYGGQAVIEGVMIRGRESVSVAVRRPNGEVRTLCEPLSSFYTGRLRNLPLVRGIIVLAETLTLGLKALMFSANAAMEEEGKEDEEMSGWAQAAMLGLSISLAVVIFFLIPLFASVGIDRLVESDILSNLIEGGLRFVIFLGYVWAIGFMPDMRRVYAYHGAEHMTIAAHEHGDALEIEAIRKHPKEHPRCGTAFLMIVIIVSILAFTFLGRPELWLLVLSRVLLVPVIAAVSYEIIRFNAAYGHLAVAKLLIAPGVALQKLTTRRPDDDQIEVAIAAMRNALKADGVAVDGVETPEAAAEGASG